MTEILSRVPTRSNGNNINREEAEVLDSHPQETCANLWGVSKATRMGKSDNAGESGVAESSRSLADREFVERLNRGYVCPPDAGPAWRAACEAGIDMSLLEEALQMTPAKRLREHQRALDLVLALIKARSSHDSRS